MTNAAAGPRTMRVFISSTFRDMQADRDELVKRVFPRLRALCEELHVAWSEVDLRWGISSEQQAEGKVLPICLAEIEQCRPYFIGLLGERYGWIPQTIAPALIDREPWLAEQAGRSVTELEIVKGVLADPEMAEHACFYFRDPAYVGGPAAEAADEDGDADDRRAKLAELKNRIRASGLPVRESYPDPRALGELVWKDLSALIERRFPLVGAQQKVQIERDQHEFFAASRREVYVGRESDFEQLDDFADSSAPLFLLLASAGQGKSALLANWIPRQQARRPDVFVLSHFVGATVRSTDLTRTLRRLVDELHAHFGLPHIITRNPYGLRQILADTLRLVSHRGRTLIVLDGIQALSDRGEMPEMDWLPRELPEGIGIIASAGPGPGLGALFPGKWRVFHLELLSEADCRTLIIRYLGYFAKSLSSDQIGRIAARYNSKNPLHLRLLLDELRVCGDPDTLAERLEYYLTADTLTTLYRMILARYVRDYDAERPNLVRDAMVFLSSSRYGLAEAELLDVLGEGEHDSRTRLPQARWAPLRHALGPSLLNRGGRLTFSHRSLRAAVEQHFLGTAERRRRGHAKLGYYFLGRGINDRTAEELAWQLCEARHWENLAKVLAIPEYLEMAWRERSDDVRTYWARIESSSAIRMPDALKLLIEAEQPRSRVSRIVLELLDDFGYLEHAAALAERIALSLARDEDRALLVHTLSLQASIKRKRGDLDGALATYDQLAPLLVQSADRSATVTAITGRAFTLLDRGDLDAAGALFREAERLALDANDPHRAAIAIGGQLFILHEKGDDDGALTLHDRETALLRTTRDRLRLARSMEKRALILLRMGQADEAADAYEEAEQLYGKLGNRSARAAAIGKRAALAASAGDDETALDLWREQQDICRAAGFLPMLKTALRAELGVLTRQNDEEGRQQVLANLRDALAATNGRLTTLSTLQARCNTGLAEGDYAAVIPLYREHAKIARDIGDLESLQLGLGDEAVALRALGRFTEALVRAKEQTAICRELGDDGLVVRSLFARVPLLVAMQRLDDAIAVTKSARDEATRAGLESEAERAASLIAQLSTPAR